MARKANIGDPYTPGEGDQSSGMSLGGSGEAYYGFLREPAPPPPAPTMPSTSNLPGLASRYFGLAGSQFGNPFMSSGMPGNFGSAMLMPQMEQFRMTRMLQLLNQMGLF